MGYDSYTPGDDDYRLRLEISRLESKILCLTSKLKAEKSARKLDLAMHFAMFMTGLLVVLQVLTYL